jgi:biopolymer transport protein TolR
MGMSLGSGRKSRTVLSEINVTPLVDVMLVLLIIFMITAPMMQQGLEVDLPETSNSGVETTEEPFMIVINKDGSIAFGDTKVSLQEMQGKLKAIFKTRKNKQVYIRADKHVDYGTVAQAMGEVRAAGIYQVGLITLPKMGL